MADIQPIIDGTLVVVSAPAPPRGNAGFAAPHHVERRPPLVIRGPCDFPLAAAIAGRRCVWCRKPIGFGRGFWFCTVKGTAVFHVDCSPAAAR